MYDYREFKIRERDLLVKAEQVRTARRTKQHQAPSNRPLATVGHMLVKVGTQLVEAYDNTDVVASTNIRIVGNNA